MSTVPKARTGTKHKRIDFACAGITMTPAEFDAIENYLTVTDFGGRASC